MRILITGGLGYLGGRLAPVFAAESTHEIRLGSRAPGRSASPSEPAIVETPWTSASGLDRICEGVDVIVHLAGMNSQACAADPVAAVEFNGGATARLVEAAIRAGVRRIVYLSTAHVYGSPLEGVITERMCPAPRHPYATSHRAAEDIVLGAGARGRMEGIVIRLSNSFGAPADKGADCWTLLVNDLCRQAVTTGTITLRSFGLQRRDLVPIEESCQAIAHLVALPAAAIGDGLFNAGGEWAPTVWEAACLVQERCRRALGVEPALFRAPRQEGDTDRPLTYRLDALRATGFEPACDRTGEIDRLIAFCQAAF